MYACPAAVSESRNESLKCEEQLSKIITELSGSAGICGFISASAGPSSALVDVPPTKPKFRHCRRHERNSSR